MENASRRYSAEKVRQMIAKAKETYGWEFLFLGANMDAVETAQYFGIGEDRAAKPLSRNWKERIEGDFQKRTR